MENSGADYTIILDRFDVTMRLGIHPHEMTPQRVRLSVEMTVRYPRPVSADAIDAVLDYDFVRTGIHALAAGDDFALAGDAGRCRRRRCASQTPGCTRCGCAR